MVGFVDDCNGQTNSFKEDVTDQSVHKLVAQTQANAQAWTDMLQASGGALELSKCSCHILQWQFSLQGAPVLVPKHSEESAQINVWDAYGNTEQSLQPLGAFHAHKTLGHFKDPAGTQGEQFHQLLTKSDNITAFLWKCPLTRLEAWTYYYACYLPAVGYPLACTFFSEKQLNTVQRKAMSIIIPRCGFNRNTKREILYGPMQYGGASF
jgi:hypothetical protein